MVVVVVVVVVVVIEATLLSTGWKNCSEVVFGGCGRYYYNGWREQSGVGSQINYIVGPLRWFSISLLGGAHIFTWL